MGRFGHMNLIGSDILYSIGG